jgi:hypothetical protein
LKLPEGATIRAQTRTPVSWLIMPVNWLIMMSRHIAMSDVFATSGRGGYGLSILNKSGTNAGAASRTAYVPGWF